jgi:hypothetical protein
MYRDLPDFDTLLSLHEEYPEELDKIRSDLTDAIFENVPEYSRRRLEGLQFRINMELRRAATPQARCIKISNMMHDSFAELHQALHNPDVVIPKENATILPFSNESITKQKSD